MEACYGAGIFSGKVEIGEKEKKYLYLYRNMAVLPLYHQEKNVSSQDFNNASAKLLTFTIHRLPG